MDQEQTPSSSAASELANHAVIFRVLIILVVLFILVAIVFGVLLLRLFIPHHSAGQQQQQQCTILSVEEGRGNGSSGCSCNSSSSSSSDPSNFMDTVYNLEQKVLQQISTTTSTTDPSTFEEEEEEEVATTLSGEELLREEFGEFLNIVQAIRKPSRPKKPQKNFEPEGGSEEESNATTSTNTTESASTSTTAPASISPSSPPPPPSIILNMTTNSVTTTTTTTPESQTYTTINFEDFGNDSNSSLHSSNSTVRKLAFIRDLLRTEWANYRAHAWGEDSLTPVSLRPVKDVFGNHTGAYLVGGLSSLWVMGLREQFQEAVEWVNRTDLEANFAAIRHTGGVHVYQTVANYLGGLLSAHVLSGEAVLLERARQLAELLEGAYVKKTGEKIEIEIEIDSFVLIILTTCFLLGLPRRSFIPDRWFRHAPSGATRPTYLPHITAAQLEYSSLYSLTGDAAYQGRLQAVTRLLAGLRRPYAGLYLDYVNPESGQWAERAEILGGSRPLYAHLIKRYIQSGGADQRSLELFKRALRAQERNRVFAVDPPTGQLLVNCLEDYEDVAVDVMLVEGCQLGATLGLGARELEREFEKTRETLTSAQRRKAQYRIYRLWELAEQITDTCYKQSLRSKSGLPASRFYFTEGGGANLGDLVNITKPTDFEYTLG